MNSVLIKMIASQATEAETLVPLSLPLSRLIMVGDDKQLPSTIISNKAADAGLGTSLFDRLIGFNVHNDLLNVQYRMKPEILEFPNRAFYENQIQCAPHVKGNGYIKQWHTEKLFGPVVFVDVPDSQEKVDENKSKFNPVEASITVGVVAQFQTYLDQHSSIFALEEFSVGIITGYRAQVNAITELLIKNNFTCTTGDGKSYYKSKNLCIDVSTVDGFQGQERDVMLISTTRANKHGIIGFMSDKRRMNVALTRARFSLWVVGNEHTLSKDKIWGRFLSAHFKVDSSKEVSKFYNVGAVVEANLKSISNAQPIKVSAEDLWTLTFSSTAMHALQKMKKSDFKR